MEEINLEGVYEISASADGKMLSTTDESIRLRLRTDREVSQKVFDLDKLQELQSKLVLVCGDKQEMGGKGVDKFLEVCICTNNIEILFQLFSIYSFLARFNKFLDCFLICNELEM